MQDSPISILGIVLPSSDPSFLALVSVHVMVALVAVVSGAIAMLSRKGPGRHPRTGTIYYWALALVVATATALAIVRWPEDNYLIVLGLAAFAAASLGRWAKRRLWPLRLHIAAMGSSYIVMLIAFYMDNGKSLPLWRDLPEWAYWALPSLVGAPILVWVLIWHPLVRRARQP